MLGPLERVEQAEAGQVREVGTPVAGMRRMLRASASRVTRHPATAAAGVPFIVAPALATMQLIVRIVCIAVGITTDTAPAPTRPVTVTTSPAAAAAPPTLAPVLARPAVTAAAALGPALQATSLLVAAQCDERLLDECDRIARIGRRGIRP